jgi:GNAT superfamily N-acetyltransferase
VALTLVPLDRVADDPDVVADIRRFDCGPEPWAQPLNDYLRNRNAHRDARARVTSTYLAYTEDDALAGYVALTWWRVDATRELRVRAGLRRIPYSSLPALFVSRLAVDARWQSQGIGREILTWTQRLIRALPVACRFVALEVASENHRAIAFYRHQHFFNPDPPNERGLLLMLFDVLD